MFLTLYDLDNLKKTCDNTSRLVSEIRKAYTDISEERKLFVSRNDYEESLKLRKQNPDDFYFFRNFDIFIQIVFNRNIKKYLIYCENYYDDLLRAFQRYQRSDKSYIISEDFETCYKVYRNLIKSYLNNAKEVTQNELFESTTSN